MRALCADGIWIFIFCIVSFFSFCVSLSVCVFVLFIVALDWIPWGTCVFIMHKLSDLVHGRFYGMKNSFWHLRIAKINDLALILHLVGETKMKQNHFIVHNWRRCDALFLSSNISVKYVLLYQLLANNISHWSM